MKNTVWKGICQTLILMLALFLISISFLQLGERPEHADGRDTIVQQWADNDMDILSHEVETALPESTEEAGDGSAPTLRERITEKVIERPRLSGLFYAGLFLLIGMYLILDAMPLKERDKKARTRVLVNAGLYLACGVPFLIAGYTSAAVVVMNVLYTAILAGELVIKLRASQKPRHFTLRTILLVQLAANLYLYPTYPMFVLVLIALRSLQQILLISFAQIRLDILRKIIRKTYASEILLGLMLLMIAFSMLLTLLDRGMNTFWDALWFCFATITTIGYGDVTTTTALGRILSVILGVYGIVVVALITSIIVNFYNEMKSEKSEE